MLSQLAQGEPWKTVRSLGREEAGAHAAAEAVDARASKSGSCTSRSNTAEGGGQAGSYESSTCLGPMEYQLDREMVEDEARRVSCDTRCNAYARSVRAGAGSAVARCFVASAWVEHAAA